VSLGSGSGVLLVGTYHFHFSFAAVFQTEWERLFQPRRGIVQCQECLMWSFPRFPFCRSEDDLERVGGRQRDCVGSEWRVWSQSASVCQYLHPG